MSAWIVEAHERVAPAPTLNEFGLPKRNPVQAVGIDGGYVKASDAPSRQEGWFEVMVGKSLPRAGAGQVFAFVHRLEATADRTYGAIPGGTGRVPSAANDVPVRRRRQPYAKRKASSVAFGEPILDWFHVAMRMTQLSQAIKGLPADPPDEQDPARPRRRVSSDLAPRESLSLARQPASGAAHHSKN